MQMKTLWITLALVILAGCNTQPSRQADIIIPFAHTGGSALAIAPDSRTLASGGWSGYVRLWDMQTGQEIGKWQAHTETVNAISFIDNERILTAGYDGMIAVWNRGGQRLSNRSSSKITSATVDVSKDTLLTGHKDGSVKLWRLSSLEKVANYPVHKGLVRSVAINHQGNLFASSATDTRVALINPSGKIFYLEKPPSDPRSLVFTVDDQELIGGGWFKLFRWNILGGNLSIVDTEHRGIINDIQFMPNGLLASISRQTDSSVLLLDPIDGTTRDRLQQHDLCGVEVAVSPDGHYLATTSDDASVRIWQLRN